jgi:hypothetical protein
MAGPSVSSEVDTGSRDETRQSCVPGCTPSRQAAQAHKGYAKLSSATGNKKRGISAAFSI